ncbi:MAG: hypothetical protein KME16_20535 [Scytolyngbya sp. HA4215-MV1]|jgi:hypothetical protein|nr:hypothetical protein [Scytolyngbya sp. HA4215-MV1]
MTASNLQRTSHLSKFSESLSTQLSGASVPLRADHPQNQGSQSSNSTKPIPALRHLSQTYHLERRWLL